MITDLFIIIVSGLFGAGGIVSMIVSALLSRQRSRWEHVAEGVMLGLENDLIIFEALKTHHINGESEVQRTKVRQYFTTVARDAAGIRRHPADRGNRQSKSFLS